MGYAVNLLGVFNQDGENLSAQRQGTGWDEALNRLRQAVQSEPPDLVILTSDDHGLRRVLMDMAAPHTSVLDSFALRIFQALKDLSGELSSTRHRLQAVEAIKEVLMAGAGTSVMVVDDEFKILDVNNAFVQWTKIPRASCINMLCYQAVKKAVQPCYARGQTCVVRDALATGKAAHAVLEELRHDRSASYYSVTAYPLREDERGKANVLVVWKDLTSGINRALDRRVKDIKEDFAYFLQQNKMVALGKLAAAAVHEINNPVQGILTFAKLMRSSLDKDSLTSKETQAFKTYLDMIAAESARCGKILSNLLSFSRRGALERAWVSVPDLLNEVIFLLANRLELGGVTVTRLLEDNLPMILVDRDQLKQGLLNILINAIEAMPEGGSISARVETRPEGDGVQISIADTGVGIPENIRANIFEPFFSTKESGKGVGLGLSVVYGIVQRHGGAIQVESVQGRGTTFVLTLPVEAAAEEEQTGWDGDE
jgi:signal transduction histidine kinase